MMSSVLLLSMWSCSSDDDNSGEGQQVPILLSGVDVSGHTSRALVTDITDFQKDGFRVMGYKQMGDNFVPIFHDQLVSYNSSEWTYSPIKYWDIRAGRYHFTAYYPASKLYVGSDHLGLSGQKLNFYGLSNWMTIGVCDETHIGDVNGENKLLGCEKRRDTEASFYDVMVAHSEDEPSTYLANNGIVNLKFHHLQAMIVFNVTYPNINIGGEGTPTYYVSKIQMPANLVPVASGTWSYEYGYDADMNFSGTYKNITYGAEGSIFDFYGSSTLNETPVEAIKYPHLIKRGLVCPFDLPEGKQFQFNVTYYRGERGLKGTGKTTEGVSPALTLMPVKTITVDPSVGLTKFEAGKIYTFTLKFDSGVGLELVDVYVSDWKVGETITQDFYNW